MKRKILIIFLFLLGINLYAEKKIYNSITVYAVDENSFFRNPIKKDNIVKYYFWKVESRFCYFDIEKISKFAEKDNYEGQIHVRIDFEENGKITTLVFYSLSEIQLELKQILPF